MTAAVVGLDKNFLARLREKNQYSTFILSVLLNSYITCITFIMFGEKSTDIYVPSGKALYLISDHL